MKNTIQVGFNLEKEKIKVGDTNEEKEQYKTMNFYNLDEAVAYFDKDITASDLKNEYLLLSNKNVNFNLKKEILIKFINKRLPFLIINLKSYLYMNGSKREKNKNEKLKVRDEKIHKNEYAFFYTMTNEKLNYTISADLKSITFNNYYLINLNDTVFQDVDFVERTIENIPKNSNHSKTNKKTYWKNAKKYYLYPKVHLSNIDNKSIVKTKLNEESSEFVLTNNLALIANYSNLDEHSFCYLYDIKQEQDIFNKLLLALNLIENDIENNSKYVTVVTHNIKFDLAELLFPVEFLNTAQSKDENRIWKYMIMHQAVFNKTRLDLKELKNIFGYSDKKWDSVRKQYGRIYNNLLYKYEKFDKHNITNISDNQYINSLNKNTRVISTGGIPIESFLNEIKSTDDMNAFHYFNLIDENYEHEYTHLWKEQYSDINNCIKAQDSLIKIMENYILEKENKIPMDITLLNDKSKILTSPNLYEQNKHIKEIQEQIDKLGYYYYFVPEHNIS